MLIARLVWDEQALHWNAEWQLDGKGGGSNGGVPPSPTTKTFRQGLGGAAQIMADKQ